MCPDVCKPSPRPFSRRRPVTGRFHAGLARVRRPRLRRRLVLHRHLRRGDLRELPVVEPLHHGRAGRRRRGVHARRGDGLTGSSTRMGRAARGAAAAREPVTVVSLVPGRRALRELALLPTVQREGAVLLEHPERHLAIAAFRPSASIGSTYWEPVGREIRYRSHVSLIDYWPLA